MKDIAPELQNSVLNDFNRRVEQDIQIQKILAETSTKATFAEVSKLAERVGEYAYQSLRENLTDKTLPDATLYWNIAKRIILPLMEQAQKVAIDMAVTVQKREDEKAGIGIKPVRPAFNEERIEAVVNKVVFLSKMPEVPDVG